ncbi:MAG: hypothetical protein AB1716_03125 [Planctomycetota bacterium]
MRASGLGFSWLGVVSSVLMMVILCQYLLGRVHSWAWFCGVPTADYVIGFSDSGLVVVRLPAGRAGPAVTCLNNIAQRYGSEVVGMMQRVVPESTNVVPIWALATPFLVSSVAAFWKPRPKARTGHCLCGYNLTGNISGRCPECGRVVECALTCSRRAVVN